MQPLNLYCAVLRGAGSCVARSSAVDEQPRARHANAGVRTVDAASDSWRDSLRVLYAEHERAQPPPPALVAWRARAGAVRRLRVLDADFALALAQLRATSALLPPPQRALCGLAVGHLDVTPLLS